MTITQTIEVPADHRVFFEFLAPQEIPAGKAKVEMRLTPIVEKHGKPVLENANGRATPHTDALLDIISKIGGDIDPDEIRAERLAKHLR